MNSEENIVDPRLWKLCAGATIYVPLPESDVCYFPQGHAEQTHTIVNFEKTPAVSPCILCKVIDVKLLADSEEEVYARIMLRPLEYDVDDERILLDTHTVSEFPFKFPYFAKRTTPSSDVYLSVPLDHAEKLFPKLADPSAQILKVRDIRGYIWEFKHTLSRRTHRLTAGWKNYFNSKQVKVGDSVVFLQAEAGDLCVGIRRIMREGIGVRGKVRPEDVIEAVSLAETGKPFEVTYYPHASNSEFVVNASSVKTALHTRWTDGTRFKMAFEIDDLSETTLLAGTVSSVKVVDPSLWPKSPWRVLQVDWDDEQEALQNVKRVSPWQVQADLVSNNPSKQGARHSGLQIGSCSSSMKKNTDKPKFQLFGQPIYSDQQVKHSSDKNANELDAVQKHDVYSSDHCKVFFGSENECRGTLDLSAVGSYEDVKETLPTMFEDEKFDNSTSFVYQDSAGVEKHMGDESFSEFASKAKRLTIIRAQKS